jgi:hypothetical protein
MPDLPVAVSERVGRRADLPAMQVDSGVAERRPPVTAHARFQNSLAPKRPHDKLQAFDRASSAASTRAGDHLPVTEEGIAMLNNRPKNPRHQRRGASFPDRARKPEAKKNGRPPADQAVNAKRNYERYMALARAAALSGDVVETENLYQHAEHYFRVMREQAL